MSEDYSRKVISDVRGETKEDMLVNSPQLEADIQALREAVEDTEQEGLLKGFLTDKYDDTLLKGLLLKEIEGTVLEGRIHMGSLEGLNLEGK